MTITGQLVTKTPQFMEFEYSLVYPWTVPLIPNMNQNVTIRTFLSVFKMYMFIILSATSDYTPYIVLKIVCYNYQYSFFRQIRGERGNRCGNLWCCVVTTENLILILKFDKILMTISMVNRCQNVYDSIYNVIL